MTSLNKKDEFDLICENYLFPLLGIPFGGTTEEEREHKSKKLVEINDAMELCIFEDNSSKKCFCAKVNKYFPRDSLSLLNTVYTFINKARKNTRNSYTSNITLNHLKKEFAIQTQKGVISWLCSDSKYTENIVTLIDILEDWKNRTYEGKNVNFAFTINTSDPTEPYNKDFEDFLNEEYCATFSDGITSVINIDYNLNCLAHLSSTSLTDQKRDIAEVPLRFADVLNNFFNGNIGIFLLSGGDIVLTKGKEIKLIKRENRWLNFSMSGFASCISALLDNDNDEFNKLANEIYLSSLDVSLSHAGGIIAYITEEKEKELTEPNQYELFKETGIFDKENSSILNYLDNQKTNLPTFDTLVKENKEIFDKKDIKKRIIKRKFVKSFIQNNKFQDIDRKLRSELISMDGATIIANDGSILATGAIIQNDSGSFGGGRGAATKKLSKYGFAIKISTDGYIECYKDERVVYKIK